MANKYWHVLHCCRPPIKDKKSKQIYFYSTTLITHWVILDQQILLYCLVCIVHFYWSCLPGLNFFFISQPYATLWKVRSTNLISLIIFNILLIWYLAWCHCPTAPCHNQSNCLMCGHHDPPPPQYWTIEHCTLGLHHTPTSSPIFSHCAAPTMCQRHVMFT